MPKLFKNYFFPLVLIIVAGFVSYKNFAPGTWLLGWDSLVPELNFKLNIARSLSATWQEYQGLGLLGGMAHAADLPRQIFLLFSSLVIPTSFLRYFWTFLMLIVGPLGVYFFVKNLAGPAGSSSLSTSSGVSPAGAQRDSLPSRHPQFEFAALVAGIFYLFNLATVQSFFVPFETFTSFFGLFPWLLFLALKYFHGEKGTDLVKYATFSLLAACAFYVQTLFVVYAIFLTVFAIESIIKKRKIGFLGTSKLAITTLAINSFWLLPVLYFSFTSASIPANSHINSIATPETQFMNQARGNFSDIVQLKGYWFDYYDWSPGSAITNGKYDLMYKNWILYSANSFVAISSLVLFGLSLIGILFAIFNKKTKFAGSALALFGISYFMLAGNNPPFGDFYVFLSGKIPLFADIFRNSYTKWSIPFALVLSLGLGFFVFSVSEFVRGKFRIVLSVILGLAVSAASIFIAFPILTGNLISKNMEVKLPNYYLEAIDYFKGQDPTARIADFPLTDFWGWHFNSWGYEGSGFLWYGVPQPMLDRTFDVWSKYNENFYSEISQAVDAKDSDQFSYVLNKYQVSYILFDSSVYEPANSMWSAQMSDQKSFLEKSGLVSKAKEFGQIAVYKVNLKTVLQSSLGAHQEDYSYPFWVADGISTSPVITENFPSNQGYKEAKNCDLMSLGSVTKEKVGGANVYTADGGGSSCDYFYYPELDHSKMYAMRITGENLTGRSLKIYLYNVDQKKNVLEELLPSGEFDKIYIINPTSKDSVIGSGYTLNVETRSFGLIKSKNKITGISFYPVEYTSINTPLPAPNELQIVGVRKFGTFAYDLKTTGNGVLELGQGYDNGWKAFPTSNFQFKIFNLQLDLQIPDFNHGLEHFKIDSWANGWIVPPGSFLSHNIYLIYWPQFLEIGGILAFFLFLFSILKSYNN